MRRCQNETGCETGALRAGSARGARGGAVKRTINPIRRTFWEKMLLQIESKPAALQSTCISITKGVCDPYTVLPC